MTSAVECRYRPGAVFDQVVGWLCWRLDGMDRDRQREIKSSVHELVAGRGPVAHAGELLSLAALFVRLRGQRAGRVGTDPWRQGAAMAATVLLVVASVDAWATVSRGDVASVRDALATCAALGVVLAGHRSAGAVIATTAGIFVAVDGDGSATSAHVVVPAATLAIVVACLLVGTVAPYRPRRGLGGSTVWMLLAAAAAAAGFAGGAGVAAWVTTLATLVAPGVFVCLCPMIPRFGAAAAVLWGWRFVASEPGGLGRALAGLGDDQEPLALLVRWCTMAVGVIVALVVTHHAVRRSAML